MAPPRIHALVPAFFLIGIAAAPAHGWMKGDVNDDGAIDPADIEPFIAVLLGQNTDPAAICAADVNSNGDADADDIHSFVEAVMCGCTCTVPSDCGLGEDCVGGFCQPAAALDIELTDSIAPCHADPNRAIEDGGEFVLCGGFQGFTELFLKIRVSGFDPGATVDWSYYLRYPNPQACPGGSCPSPQECDDGVCSIGFGHFFTTSMTDEGCGINTIDFPDVLFTGPVALHGQDTILSVTVTDSDNPLITVTTTMQVTLNVPLFCFFQGQCPPNHTCVANYCFPN